mmetsp:Transcript_6655/g.19153  ORF Transcript_6655/g.19153 Transcript_6655/m.19153 type:complete len:225 (+) Transcript_6655:2828-3502(+)
MLDGRNRRRLCGRQGCRRGVLELGPALVRHLVEDLLHVLRIGRGSAPGGPLLGSELVPGLALAQPVLELDIQLELAVELIVAAVMVAERGNRVAGSSVGAAFGIGQVGSKHLDLLRLPIVQLVGQIMGRRRGGGGERGCGATAARTAIISGLPHGGLVELVATATATAAAATRYAVTRRIDVDVAFGFVDRSELSLFPIQFHHLLPKERVEFFGSFLVRRVVRR